MPVYQNRWNHAEFLPGGGTHNSKQQHQTAGNNNKHQRATPTPAATSNNCARPTRVQIIPFCARRKKYTEFYAFSVIRRFVANPPQEKTHHAAHTSLKNKFPVVPIHLRWCRCCCVRHYSLLAAKRIYLAAWHIVCHARNSGPAQTCQKETKTSQIHSSRQLLLVDMHSLVVAALSPRVRQESAC